MAENAAVCEKFSKLGKGRPSKAAVCLTCGKPVTEHTSVKRKVKAAKPDPTASTVVPTVTTEATVPSSVGSPASAAGENSEDTVQYSEADWSR